MAKKIEIIDESLVVTDTTSGKLLFDVPKNNYYFNLDQLNNGHIQFIAINDAINIMESTIPFLLSEAIDSLDASYTRATFLTFARANLGFKTALGSSEAIGDLGTTGVKHGGLLTPNVSTTTFDVSDGVGYVVDTFTNPLDPPVVTKVEWSGLTNITATNIATDNFSSIAINSVGTIIQQTTVFTEEQSRDLIIWGTVSHINNVNITSAEDMSYNVSSSYLARDLANALGNLNLEGNNITAASTDLTLRLEAGNTFRPNVNRNNNPRNPNFLSSPLINPLTWIYTYNDGSGGNVPVPLSTDVDPSMRDDGTGTLDAVPAGNNWTNQWFYFFPGSNFYVLRYGEYTYSTLAAAKLGVDTDKPSTIGNALNRAFIRSVISIKVGTTDLTDVANVYITPTGILGLI